MLEQFVKAEWDILIFPGIATCKEYTCMSFIVRMFIPVQQQNKMKVSWIKITNSGTRASLVQEYLSVFAKGWREDARRRKRHAWHNADGRCSGLACDRSNVTVVHLSVVGGLQIQTRLSSFAEREEQVARRTSQERVNPFWHWNNYMISIPSSSNTTSALQRMPMMIVQMLQHAPYWFRVLGWRGKKHVVQHCMFRSICRDPTWRTIYVHVYVCHIARG